MDTAALPLKASGTTFCYSFSVSIRLSSNASQSEMRSVYGDNYFTRRAIDVSCKKFAHGREGVVDEERPGEMLFRLSTIDATVVAVDSLMRSDRLVTG